ncbi:MAG: DUF1318 domain-containing protein [Victivallaceae bacterium]|nr:DUF1318 domain-containing protein [Victivallaceae bacterium]
MKKLFKTIIIALAFGCTALTVTAAAAPDLKSVQKSMADRLKDVVELKTAGGVGENNLGYLVARDKQKTTAELVAAENADRKAVYDALAAKDGKLTSKAVGQQRAIAIAKKAQKGEWLQSAAGEWYQKGSAADPDMKKK